MSSKTPSLEHVEKDPTTLQGRDVPSPDSVELGGPPPGQDWTEEEEKALVRKIDLRVIPMMAVVFSLSLLDRANISSAYISGMAVNLDMVQGVRYSVALLVFFPAYVIFQLPSNLVIRRIGARYWLSILILGFGIIVLGMGFVQNWVPLAVLRALLGAFEAGLLPGCIYLVTCWYRTNETAKRISFFYLSAIVAVGFGGILAYVFQLIRVGDGIFSQGWRWIYIIEGILTIVAGVACFFTVPEFPEKATWLSDRQRHISAARIKLDRGEQEWKQVSTMESLKLFLDPKLLVTSYMYFAVATSSYSISFFFPIILTKGMGFSYTTALLLFSPPYFFAIIGSMALAWVSDKYRTRWTIMMFQSSCAILGFLLILLVKPAGVRLFGIFMAVFGIQSNAATIHVYSQNQAASPEKRSMTAVAMVMAGAIGGIAGSTVFRSQDAPDYLPGMITSICLQGGLIISLIPMTIYLKRQNRLCDEGKIGPLDGVVGFRYTP